MPAEVDGTDLGVGPLTPAVTHVDLGPVLEFPLVEQTRLLHEDDPAKTQRLTHMLLSGS